MARSRTWMTAALLGAGLALSSVGGASAQDADTPLDKALQKVETLLATLKAQPGTAALQSLIDQLQDVADNLRKEKESRGGGAKSPGGGGASPALPGGGVSDWVLNETKKSFVKGCDLKDDEKALADVIITEFVTDYNLAKSNEDEKSKPVVRDHTEKRIGRSFGPKDANKLKDNLDEIIKFWERGWGRGGKGR